MAIRNSDRNSGIQIIMPSNTVPSNTVLRNTSLRIEEKPNSNPPIKVVHGTKVVTDNRRVDRSKLRLTNCEREVLQLKAQGKSSKDVANELFISKRTVDFHLASIYKRLEVSSLLAACTKAAKAGLITMDTSPVNSGQATTEASA